MKKFTFFMILLLIAGPIGLVIYALAKFRKFFHWMRQKHVLGWTGIFLGVFGIILSFSTNIVLGQFDLNFNVPAYLDPRNLTEAYFILSVLLMIGGCFILWGIESGKWLILFGGLLSFAVTVFPAMLVSEAMMDALRPSIGNVLNNIFQSDLAHSTFLPFYKFYFISTFLAAPLMDIYFVILLACASFAYQNESVFDLDRQALNDEWQSTEIPKQPERLLLPLVSSSKKITFGSISSFKTGRRKRFDE